MKTGVVASVVVHAALLILAVVGLTSAKPLEPEVVESIAVELVPISEVTNIRVGSLESTVVETETPAVVKSEKPAELAKPTGNTEEDQVTPKETEAPTPAPVTNTAPEPEAAAEPTPPEPVEKPPEPTPEPPAEPEPAPVEETPEPEVAAETPAEAPPAKPAAPMPMLRPAAIQKTQVKKPAETKVAEATPPPKTATKAETPKKPAKATTTDAATKEADLNDLIQNLEKSRGAATGEGGEPTLGKNDGRASTLTQSQLDGLIAQIKGCFVLPPSMIDSTDSTRLEFSLDGNGKLTADPKVTQQVDSSTGRALASAARRAVIKCGPYPMAAGQDVGATFTTEQLT